MIFTFYKARGLNVGSSLVEDDKMDLARDLEAKAKAAGVELILPTDVVVADAFSADANSKVVPVDAIPDGWMVSWIWYSFCHFHFIQTQASFGKNGNKSNILHFCRALILDQIQPN